MLKDSVLQSNYGTAATVERLSVTGSGYIICAGNGESINTLKIDGGAGVNFKTSAYAPAFLLARFETGFKYYKTDASAPIHYILD